MSRRDVEPLLHDIVKAGQRILDYIGSESVKEYVSDEVAHDVAERNFITIGEALMQVLKAFPELDKNFFRGARIHRVSTRADPRLPHDRSIRVWSIIESDLPRLLTECRSLLGELPA